jgi:hypothetical protein
MEIDRMSARVRGKRSPRDKASAPNTGFYSRVLDEAERLDFELASGVEGIDDEIALLRVKIKSLLENEPENIRLIMQVTNALERLVRTRYSISKEQRKGLKEAIGNVIKDIAIPLGIGVGVGLKNKGG